MPTTPYNSLCPLKRCLQCEADFPRNPKESWPAYAKRRFCCRACAAAWRGAHMPVSAATRERMRQVQAERNRKRPAQYVIEDRGYETPCWVWLLFCNAKGYPQMSRSWVTDGVLRKRSYSAHRYYYELAKGPVPPGLTLDHLCRVRCCVNPDHLEPVTQGENVRRGIRRKADRGEPRYAARP